MVNPCFYREEYSLQDLVYNIQSVSFWGDIQKGEKLTTKIPVTQQKHRA